MYPHQCRKADAALYAACQAPVHGGVVVEMNVDAVVRDAVEIAGQRSKRAFEVGRAARGVVPGVADLVARSWIVSQRIPIAIKLAIERHAGVDAVVQRTLHDVGKA